MIPKIDTLTPDLDECFTKSDQMAFSNLHLFNHFLLKSKMQIKTRICDFKLLLLTPRSLSSEHPKSQILVVFVVGFAHIFDPRRRGEQTMIKKLTHGRPDTSRDLQKNTLKDESNK